MRKIVQIFVAFSEKLNFKYFLAGFCTFSKQKMHLNKSINQGGPMCRVTSRQSKNILFLKWVPRDDQQF